MKHDWMIKLMLGCAIGTGSTACTVTGEGDPDDPVEEEITEDEEPKEEEIVKEEEPEEEEGVLVSNEEVDEPDTILTEVPDPVMDPSPVATNPVPTVWEPNNNGASPQPVNQGDLRMVCQKMGAGLEAGFVRYGCNAMHRDGQHYGIVKGWWEVRRRDGARAKSKSLNFREGGFDMAVDVLATDAAHGIAVRPGSGEAVISRGR